MILVDVDLGIYHASVDDARHHDEFAVCRCVADHRPPVLEGEFHHVHPLYLGGPKTGELVYLCATTHDSVHEILRLMLRHGPLTHSDVQTLERPRVVSRYAYALALRGFDAYRTAFLAVP